MAAVPPPPHRRTPAVPLPGGVVFLTYSTKAPHFRRRDTAALVLLWPLVVLLIRIFGERVIQVEHAGVVASVRCFGILLSRRVWTAKQVLHFDWERTADELFNLRLLLLNRYGRSSFFTVLHTDSAYALAAVWRDLELHFPGSGLRTEHPSRELSPGGGSCWFGLLLLLLGGVSLIGLWRPMSRPVMAAALGEVTPAVVQGIEWSGVKGSASSYQLRMLPTGASAPVRTVSSFDSHVEHIPLIGQTLPILWAEDLPYCYLPGEVLGFLIPIPVFGFCVLLLWLGAWGVYQNLDNTGCRNWNSFMSHH